ncbi:hypothetical protein SEUCBS140593_005500 [Sporothrix eucalyptigena]|uniref:Ketoreductase domain-containing protein n=1 Tax=Sporothrix eucalyptigena TaxID=1812306 RepID=A0ABP0BXN7_9PEZI
MQIKDRTFIVSGGSSGLGLATTIQLLAHGAHVSIFDLNPPPEDATASVDSSCILFVEANVTSTPSLEQALNKTLQWIQTTTHKPLGGTICCAGIGGPALILPRQNPAATHDNLKYFDLSVFDRVLAVNLRGTVDLIRLTAPNLALNEPDGPDGERGIIVVVSSVAAFEGQVGQLSYSASKGAVRSIVLPLARELGPRAGVRVMGIAPGVFETAMTKRKPAPAQVPSTKDGNRGTAGQKPAVVKSALAGNREMVQFPRRMGSAGEFARLVKEIVENPMLNGEVIRLDGGIRLPSRI